MSRRNFVRPGSYPGFLRVGCRRAGFGAIALLAACKFVAGRGWIWQWLRWRSGRAGDTACHRRDDRHRQHPRRASPALCRPRVTPARSRPPSAMPRELALRDFKTAGIQILVKDDLGTAEGARAAASDAIAQGAELILGPLSRVRSMAYRRWRVRRGFRSSPSRATRPLPARASTSSRSCRRATSTGSSRSPRTQGKRSIAALLPNNAYGTLVEAALQRAAANSGGRVMATERYELDKDRDADAGDCARRAGQGRHGRRDPAA